MTWRVCCCPCERKAVSVEKEAEIVRLGRRVRGLLAILALTVVGMLTDALIGFSMSRPLYEYGILLLVGITFVFVYHSRTMKLAASLRAAPAARTWSSLAGTRLRTPVSSSADQVRTTCLV